MSPVDPRQKSIPVKRKSGSGLTLACLLGMGLLLISYSRIVGDMGSAAFNIEIVKGALSGPVWRTRLGLNIALFTLAQLALHVAFGIACWLLALASCKAYPGANCSRRQWVLVWFLPGLLWLLVANATRFPNSSLGEPYNWIRDFSLSGLTPLAIATVGLLGMACVTLVLALKRAFGRNSAWIVAGSAAVATICGFSWQRAASAAPPAEHPHVIFLGIDSLRPDAVDAQSTPHVHAFLDQAVWFSDTITPLARTFPSWVSVLTGRHPHTTGAFMNLLPPNLVHTGTTLPQLLRGHGYRTYYAIDETRFSNIDATYGFDRTAVPTMGGSDFVLTWFADTPLSNLVANTALGALLLPHVHANRAAHTIYDPDSFVRRMDREFDFDQPVFLAAHLTLPHWPFSWATSAYGEPTEERMLELYRDSVRRADQQLGDLLAMLHRRGALGNALVVLLSDHGEALGGTDDLMSGAFAGQEESALRSQKWGHGTSVFSPHQYRVVLGIRAYGLAAPLISRKGIVDVPASLLDVAPTVLDLLAIEPREAFDGQSLAALVQSSSDASRQLDGRIRFTESEYNPQGFSFDQFSRSGLAAAAKVYRLDPDTDRITVRSELIDWIMSTRQYAALAGDSFAGAVPDAGDGNYRLVYHPGSGEDSSRNRLRLRQALEQRFGIRFTSETILRPGPG